MLFACSGTNRYFRKVAERMNLQTSFVDATDVECFRASMKPNTKVRKMTSSILGLTGQISVFARH